MEGSSGWSLSRGHTEGTGASRGDFRVARLTLTRICLFSLSSKRLFVISIVVLTHDHDVGVRQQLPVHVGRLALVDSAVGGLGVVYDDGVAQDLPVGCRRLCKWRDVLTD